MNWNRFNNCAGFRTQLLDQLGAWVANSLVSSNALTLDLAIYSDGLDLGFELFIH